MEEFVGNLWHRWVTRAAARGHPDAAVELREVEKTVGILFRALGGDGGLRVAAAGAQTHGGRRRWLERLAGTNERTEFATRDHETLRLPQRLDLLPAREHNRDLYLWLAAVAAAQEENGVWPAAPDAPPPASAPDANIHAPSHSAGSRWLITNQQAAAATLARFPGLGPRYRRLAEAVVTQRIAPAKLPGDEAAQEHAIRLAILEPGSVSVLPPARRPPQAVPLWLYPALDQATAPAGEDGEPETTDAPEEDGGKRRQNARRVEQPRNDAPMVLPFRAESLLSLGQYVKVNRDTDDEPDPNAARLAEELDSLAVMRDGKRTASKVRFDLDLPSAAEDDTPLGEGLLQPEWNWRRRELVSDHVCLQEMVSRSARPGALPAELRRTAHRLRRQFEALTPGRVWLRAQPDGSELDMDAWVEFRADLASGRQEPEPGLYRTQVRRNRDLACLLLADLSLSTDAHISNEHRVIDVIRNSLYLFGEALATTGDRFAFYGFSSLKRSHVRMHVIKSFAAPYDATARGNIAALKPGWYTRMGAAIRRATGLLEKEGATQRLLIVLTDGKPMDIDHYEGRYGIEDTRQAVMAARQAGLHPFCVTIDREAAAYLPHMFGTRGFVVIRRPEELPRELPLLYARLTA